MKLDKAWEECLRMWKEISEGWDESRSIVAMKMEYCKKKGIEELYNRCFFCAYGKERREKDDFRTCKHCPGKLVDLNFSCGNSEYHYSSEPKKFYQELLRLNAIRLGRIKDEGSPSNIQKS